MQIKRYLNGRVLAGEMPPLTLAGVPTAADRKEVPLPAAGAPVILSAEECDLRKERT